MVCCLLYQMQAGQAIRGDDAVPCAEQRHCSTTGSWPAVAAWQRGAGWLAGEATVVLLPSSTCMCYIVVTDVVTDSQLCAVH
jgi:hypothetical protein